MVGKEGRSRGLWRGGRALPEFRRGELGLGWIEVGDVWLVVV